MESVLKVVKVKAIRKVARPELVCDVGVEDNHNLFVSDTPDQEPILVHNCWSLFTGDQTVADLFQNGHDLQQEYRLFPTDALLGRLKTEGDVHRINASYFFGVPITEIDDDLRGAVKAVIFGLIYQQGLKGLAMSTKQAMEVIEDLVAKFKKKHPIGVAWFEAVKKLAKKHLFVQSPLGRRRHTWGHLLPDEAVNAREAKSRTERQSVNSPIQGIGSDFLIIGARNIERLKFEHYEEHGHYPDFYQANSVHDSISFSCAYEDLWLAINIIERGLTSEVAEVVSARYGMDFIVPLAIDFDIGNNERDVKSWKGSLLQLETIVHGALLEKAETDTELDVKKTLHKMCRGSVQHMPDWAKKQASNIGYKIDNLVDIRKKADIRKGDKSKLTKKGGKQSSHEGRIVTHKAA